MKLIITVIILSLVAMGQNSARMVNGVNSQTGTTYAIQAIDQTRLTTFSNANPVAVTLPSGLNANFGSGALFSVQNLGPGAVTITCQACLIFSTSGAGAATLVLGAGFGSDIWGSASGNYYAFTVQNPAAVLLNPGGNQTILGGTLSVPSGITAPITATGGNVIINNPSAPQTITGPQPFVLNNVPFNLTGTSVMNGKVGATTPNTGTFTSVNNILKCDAFSGADMSLKIQAAVTSLSGANGTIDCRGLTGNQVFTVDPFTGVVSQQKIKLITGSNVITFNASTTFISVHSYLNWEMHGTTLRNTNPGGAPLHSGFLNSNSPATTGSITSGSSTLTVASAADMIVGGVVGILGAKGGETNQATTLTAGINNSVTTIPIVSDSGWFTSGVTNYLKIDSEIVSCTSSNGTNFLGCTRGLFGTTAASHLINASVQAVCVLTTQILGVSGTTITIQNPATFTVTNTTVYTGPVGVSINGTGTFDGGSNLGTPTHIGLYAAFMAQSYIGPSISFNNWDDAGIALQACAFNYISGRYAGNGNPVGAVGFDIFLIGQNYNNTINTTSHTNGDYVIQVDDRSTHIGIFDGPSFRNTITIGEVVNSNYVGVVDIEGTCSNNTAYVGAVSVSNATFAGISIYGSGQWTSPVTPSGNVIYVGSIIQNGAAPAISTGGIGPYSGGFNTIVAGSVTGTVQIASGDQVIYNGSGTYNVAKLSINTDTAMSAAPRIITSALIPSTTGPGTFYQITVDKAITITRVQILLDTAGAGQTTAAVIRTGDGAGGNNSDITLSNGSSSFDSGAITINLAAGALFQFRVNTASVGGTPPAGVHIMAQYKMQ